MSLIRLIALLGAAGVSAPPAPSGVFSVTAGGSMLRPDGAPFYARGINSNAYSLPDAVGADAANLLLFFPGINIVRIALNDFSPMSDQEVYVNALTDLGIVALLEPHWIAWPDKAPLTGAALTAQSAWYAAGATYYSANPYVWFGSPNEPQQAEGDPIGSTIAELCAEHAATYDAIRNAGNNNPILFQPYAGGNPDQLGDLETATYADMHNVGFDMHYYNWVTGFSNDAGVIAAKIAEMADQLQSTYPSADGTMAVIVGEWGDSTTGDAPADVGWEQVVATVTANPYSGWMAWCWDPGGTGDRLFENNNPVDGLTVYGEAVAVAIGTTPPPLP